MKIEVISRSIVPFLVNETRSHLTISIMGSTDTRALYDYNPACHGRLGLTFDDIDEPTLGYRLFSKHDADNIIRQTNRCLNDIEVIICQCEAGISRSAGVAAALSRWLNGEDQYYFAHYMPNRYVYNLILERLREKGKIGN